MSVVKVKVDLGIRETGSIHTILKFAMLYVLGGYIYIYIYIYIYPSGLRPDRRGQHATLHIGGLPRIAEDLVEFVLFLWVCSR